MMATEAPVEDTFVLLKPDALRRRLVGEIISRLEGSGADLVAAQMLRPSKELAGEHYGQEIEDKYGPQVRGALLDYLCAGPCLATVWRGPDAVARVRETVGLRAQPADCAPGTIRRDLATDTIAASRAEGRALENLVHASDGPESAAREVELWGLL